MAERDLRQRYVGSVLGYLWAVVYPLLFVAVYAFVFTVIFRGRLNANSTPDQYALYVISGLLPWVSFSEVAARAPQTAGEHRNLIKHVVFPVHILPVTTLYATALSQAVGLIALLALAFWGRGGADAGALVLIPVIALQTLFLAGVAWGLGAVGALAPDVKEVVQVSLTIGMFFTPIFYTEEALPSALRPIMDLNPLAHLVRLYHDAVLGYGLQHPASLVIFAGWAIVVLLVGFASFERARATLADLL
jgi:lipopolysaccharide transport system permease protein